MGTLSDTGSAIPPPPGVTTHPGESSAAQRKAWLVATTVMVVVPTIFVAIRLLVRFHYLRTWNMADVTCILAWCLLVMTEAEAFRLLGYGIGSHGWNLSPLQFSRGYEILNIEELFYEVAMFFTKAAIFLQLYQVFCVGKHRLRRGILLGAIVINAIFYIALFFMTLYGCNPRASIWNPTIHGSCLDTKKVCIATAVVNLSDYLLVVILPVSWIWQLNMGLKRKVGISAVFAATIFSCLCSVMRLVESLQDGSSEDVTYAWIAVALWSSAEVASGVVVCCLPLLPAFYHAMLRTSKSRSKSSPGQDGAPGQPRDIREPINPDSLLFDTRGHVETNIRTAAERSDSVASFESGQGGTKKVALDASESFIMRSVNIVMTSRATEDGQA